MSSSIETSGSLQKSEKCAVSVGEVSAADRGEVAGPASGLQTNTRATSLFPRPADRLAATRISAAIVAWARLRLGGTICYHFPSFGGVQVNCEMLLYDLGKNFARLDFLQSDVTFDRGLHIAMTEKLSH